MTTAQYTTIDDPDDGRPALHSRFLAGFDREALRIAAICVSYAHIEAETFSSEHFGEFGEQASIIGLIRWMRSNCLLLERLRGFGGQLEAELVRNGTNAGSHVEIRQGGFRLILIHDPDPDVKPSKFRSQYSKDLAEQNVGPLFAMLQPEAVDDDSEDLITAVMYHRRGLVGSAPDRLEIRFPEGLDYAASHLRLRSIFPDLADSEFIAMAFDALTTQPVPEEEIEDQSFPAERQDDANEESA